MIKITAKSIVKAGAREEFIATARELVENSRAEAGNISYHLYEDIDDPNILTFIEEWKDPGSRGRSCGFRAFPAHHPTPERHDGGSH